MIAPARASCSIGHGHIACIHFDLAGEFQWCDRASVHDNHEDIRPQSCKSAKRQLCGHGRRIGYYTPGEEGWDFENETTGAEVKDFLKQFQLYRWNFAAFDQ